MIYSLVALMLLASQASAFKSSPSAFTSPSTILRASSNSDMFGGPSTPKVPEVAPKISPLSAEATTDSYKTQAAKLRQEAAEMEVALREEARAKGLPEEMINKLVPLRSPTQSSTAVLEAPAEVKLQTLTASEIRAKLGYLNSGDAVRFTSELDRIRAKGILRLWNSKDLSKLDASDFVVSNAQLKNKGKIEAVKLKLDDVGFKYQNVLVGAIVIGTVCGLSSSAIGGQLGFLLGYASALFPILLVGIGSIAPALIGDILNRISYLTNSEAKDRYITQNAAKFLVGYSVGLPVSRFGSDGFSNVPEFFQIRPNTEDKATKSRAMFSKGFSQKDIARCAITCLGKPYTHHTPLTINN